MASKEIDTTKATKAWQMDEPANALKQLMTDFFSASKEQQAGKLKDFVENIIPSLVKKDTLDAMITSLMANEMVRRTAEETFKMAIDTGSGKRKWGDGYVLVAFDESGELLGFAATEAKIGNLHYAVSKILYVRALDSPEIGSGSADITEKANQDYLKQYGIELGKNVYLGGIAPITLQYRGKVYFAAGSVYFENDHVKEMAGEEPGKDGTGSLAGLAETEFATEAAKIFQQLYLDEAKVASENSTIRLLRTEGVVNMLRKASPEEKKDIVALYS